jgi:hypothetical protein
MNCAVWVLSGLLLSSALPVNSVHHSRHVVERIERKAAPPAEPGLPVTVYGDAANAASAESSAVVTVLAEDRGVSAAGMPETVYGDAEPRQVIEIAAANSNDVALPVTAYAGGAEMAAEGMPETVYADGWKPGPVHEAQIAADEINGEGGEGMAGEEDGAPDQGMASEPDTEGEAAAPVNAVANAEAGALPPQDSLPLFRNWPGLPMETASPYSSYTDAQRAGMNPCEDKQPGPSPYGELTDAQRAAQTNCR